MDYKWFYNLTRQGLVDELKKRGVVVTNPDTWHKDKLRDLLRTTL